ncbi:MAG: hypothetical protein ACJLTB_05765 [Algoriphagus aquaeductus]|uniref:hypothetical protein n=1 Tax=Algoriphagus aquaeductus TaxID=475299 RepID=UPI00387A4AC6
MCHRDLRMGGLSDIGKDPFHPSSRLIVKFHVRSGPTHGPITRHRRISAPFVVPMESIVRCVIGISGWVGYATSAKIRSILRPD